LKVFDYCTQSYSDFTNIQIYMHSLRAERRAQGTELSILSSVPCALSSTNNNSFIG